MPAAERVDGELHRIAAEFFRVHEDRRSVDERVLVVEPAGAERELVGVHAVTGGDGVGAVRFDPPDRFFGLAPGERGAPGTLSGEILNAPGEIEDKIAPRPPDREEQIERALAGREA